MVLPSTFNLRNEFLNQGQLILALLAKVLSAHMRGLLLAVFGS